MGSPHSFCGSGIWVQLSEVPSNSDLPWSWEPSRQPGLGPPPKGLTGEDALLSSLAWTWTMFSFSWAVGLRVLIPCWLQRSLSIVCHADFSTGHFSIWQLTPVRASSVEVRESTQESFSNWTLEAASHRLCYILFVRGKSVSPVHTQDRSTFCEKRNHIHPAKFLKDEMMSYLESAGRTLNHSKWCALSREISLFILNASVSIHEPLSRIIFQWNSLDELNLGKTWNNSSHTTSKRCRMRTQETGGSNRWVRCGAGGRHQRTGPPSILCFDFPSGINFCNF